MKKRQMMIFRFFILFAFVFLALISCKQPAKNSHQKPKPQDGENYTIRFSNNEGGKLKATTSEGVLSNPAVLKKGTVIHLKAEPLQDYEVASWQKATVPDNNNLNEAIHTVEKDETVAVFFQKKNPKPQDGENYTIRFSNNEGGKLKATTSEGVLSNPAVLKKGIVIHLKAEPFQDYEVASWQKATVPDNNNLNEAIHTVEKDETVAVFFQKKGGIGDRPIIEFDATEISCTKGGLLGVGETVVSNGDVVEIGTTLSFKAKVTGTTTVKSWKINGEIQENQTGKTFSYKMKKEDVQDGRVKVSIEKNMGYPIVIRYDSTKIKCNKSGLLSGAEVPSESTVEIGDSLSVTGTPSENKAIDRWYVNDKEKAVGTTLTYKVAEADCVKDGEKLVLSFSFTEKELQKLKISFDTKKVQCNKPGSLLAPGEPILNDSEVIEGEKIVFTAKTGQYEDVKEWLVKGSTRQKGNEKFSYTVDAKDEDSDGKIVVSWTLSHKIKIEFDKKKITCKTKNLLGLISVEVASGTFHSEGQNLYLYPKLKEGEKLKGWYLNGKKHTSLAGLLLDNIIYEVSNSDAEDQDGYRYIKITTKTEFVPKIQIKFDEDKLECKNGDLPISSDESVWDKTKLIFKVKSEDKGATKWYINGKEKKYGISLKKFEYVMYADEALVQGNKKVMEITFDEIALKKILLKFDSKIKCQDEDDSTVSSGTSLYEGVPLTFTATLPEEVSIASWQVGSKTIKEKKSTINYTLSLSDTTEDAGVFTLNVSVNIIEKIKILFDEATIYCEVSDGSWFLPKYTSVQNGDLLDVGSYLRFKALQPDQATFSKWLVNGQEKSGNKDYKMFTYTVDASDAKLNGNIKEIRVTIEKR